MGAGAPGYNPAAMILDRLDKVVDLLQIQAGLPPTTHYIQDIERIDTPAQLARDQNYVMEMLLSALVPSAPSIVEAYQVSNVETLLASNESIPLMRVEVTNDNVAQALWVARRGVLPTTGRRIIPLTTVPFVLPMGTVLTGICAIPWISVRVSIGYDFFAILQDLKARRAGM